MFNDATVLVIVIYRVALAAVVTTGLGGIRRPASHVGPFVGAGLGVALGWVTKWILAALLEDAPAGATAGPARDGHDTEAVSLHGALGSRLAQILLARLGRQVSRTWAGCAVSLA